MAPEHFLLWLCVATSYAVEFEIWEKTPENNPDLNTEGLGALQNAWQTIKHVQEEEYYLMYNSHQSSRYEDQACVRLRTSNLTVGLKSANYTKSWYNMKDKKLKTITGGVEARKQKDYVNENVMRFSGLVRRRRPTKGGSLNGSYNMIEYYDDDCRAGIREIPKNTGDYDEYVVISEKLCYVSRSVRLQGSCEFWVRASWLNETLSGTRECTSEIKEEKNEDALVEGTETFKQPMETLFKELPVSCRLAFLFNCGYPTSLIYKKSDCDEMNQAENAV